MNAILQMVNILLAFTMLYLGLSFILLLWLMHLMRKMNK